MLQSEDAFGKMGIRDGLDVDVAEFNLAKEHKTPRQFIRAKGWARRAERGDVHGSKHVENFKEETEQFVQPVVNDKDKKMGPSNIQDHLIRRHAKMHAVPSFIEIQSYVQQSLARKEKGNDPNTRNTNQLPD